MQEVVIVSGATTPVGSFGGVLKDVSVVDLGARVIKEAMKRAGLRPFVSDAMKAAAPDKLRDQGVTDLEKQAADWDPAANPVAVDEVIMGNVLIPGQGQNPARQSMIRAGMPKETPAFTINTDVRDGEAHERRAARPALLDRRGPPRRQQEPRGALPRVRAQHRGPSREPESHAFLQIAPAYTER